MYHKQNKKDPVSPVEELCFQSSKSNHWIAITIIINGCCCLVEWLGQTYQIKTLRFYAQFGAKHK